MSAKQSVNQLGEVLRERGKELQGARPCLSGYIRHFLRHLCRGQYMASRRATGS